MERLAHIIQKTYHKYAKIFEQANITFDLDFPDTTLAIEQNSHVEKHLDKAVKSAVERTRSGKISISVQKQKIIVRDTGTTLSKTVCEALNSEHFKVKSRVGFGTEVTILF
ncbi:MAG: hypothetical protein Q4B34_02520 [Candidatus Saccharibacteria bacterium]|nr:hypothetical protein [Candidatus Saccharibacteria bacterium]